MNASLARRHLNILVLVLALKFGRAAGLAAEGVETAAPVTPAAATNAAAPAEAPRANTAVIPRLATGFMPRHTNFVEIAKKGDIDVLFMGDSITDWWRMAPPNGGREVFEKNFGSWKVANFGIAGDTTQ